MRQFMMIVMALAVFGAVAATAQAQSQSVRPSRAVSAAQSTCTELKFACRGSDDRGRAFISPRYYHVHSRCLYLGGSTPAPAEYCQNLCNFIWEQCMKTGFWEGALIHRPAERR
jgi:hypothetical protein